MDTGGRIQRFLGPVANLAILVGLVLVLAELRQNTEHLRLQLRDQINDRLYENNRVLMGDEPLAAVEKSLTAPEEMTYREWRVVDAYLINAVNEWEDRYLLYQSGLASDEEWRHRVDEDIAWFFGNRFAKAWWSTAGEDVVEAELAAYISLALERVPDTATFTYYEASRAALASQSGVGQTDPR